MPGANERQALAEFVSAGPLVVLTGAGLSTAAGIPDYRDTAGAWKRPPPVDHRDYLASAAVRQRYWARAMAGWTRFATAEPSASHRALAALEAAGHIRLLITQNVDGLHQRAGSQAVLDLHGRLAEVVCLHCATVFARHAMQDWMRAANPDRAEAAPGTPAPDGDADLPDEASAGFVVPACPACGGVLKPDVVFFGDNVPRARVEAAFAALDRAAGLLVLGSSLMVYSGYRFCERAWRRGLPIAAVNRGHTRADALFQLKLDVACDDAIPRLAADLGLL